ncbi:Coenzyme F420 hydrogenase/dehydrogenase, beta subunit C-terminal domain [uncultured Robinsoniella sp.]|uniref:Coenzyme F420 hydrogenase/dehydrogenase, beta subunit C-terminal domain n=1 Tax=uncultured Robinsoniella sp. TaxID=904190 RepID=UPI00374F07FA
MNTYAAYAIDDNLRKQSSSGAIFSLLAEQILLDGGLVYGVCLTDDCKSAEFDRVDRVENLGPLRTSKYFQAKVGSTYKFVKDDLDTGKTVLFTGVGCQINGLKIFLQKKYENLYCMDMICHGVPSPKLWRKYVAYMEEKNQAKIVGVNFRCKDRSWTDFGIKEIDEHRKEVFISKDEDPFLHMFLTNVCLRPSCYECHAKIEKKADITLGDFWGIENIDTDMYDGKGTSLVIIRTGKGRKLFAKIENKIRVKQTEYKAAIQYNSAEYKSVMRPFEREVLFEDLNNKSFDEMIKRYGMSFNLSLKRKLKRKLKTILVRTNVWGGVKHNNQYGLLFTMKKESGR